MDGPVALEFLLVRPDGKTRLIAETVRAAPVGHDPVETIGAVLDITDRMRAEEETRTTYARLFQQDKAFRNVWAFGPSIPGTPDPLVGPTDADFLPPLGAAAARGYQGGGDRDRRADPDADGPAAGGQDLHVRRGERAQAGPVRDRHRVTGRVMPVPMTRAARRREPGGPTRPAG